MQPTLLLTKAFCEAFAAEPSQPLQLPYRPRPFLMLECLGKEMNAFPQWEGFSCKAKYPRRQKIGLDDNFGNANPAQLGRSMLEAI